MAGGSSSTPPVKQHLLLSMTVGSVKQLMKRLFNCDVAFQRLSFCDAAAPYPALMEDDLKPLSYYAVADGSEIYMEEVDPAEAARQAEEARRVQEGRLTVATPRCGCPGVHCPSVRTTHPPPTAPDLQQRRRSRQQLATRSGGRTTWPSAPTGAQPAQWCKTRRVTSKYIVAMAWLELKSVRPNHSQ